MRYLGSKAKIAKDIVPIIQSYIDNNGIEQYWEPFVGGANIIDKINCKVRVGTDIHPQLVALLQQAQTDISVFPDTISEEEYKEVKNNKDKYPDWYVGLVGFCSFGSKYWGGYRRSYDKEGRAKDETKGVIDNIKKQALNLKDISFNCLDYSLCTPYNFHIEYDMILGYQRYRAWKLHVGFEFDLMLPSLYYTREEKLVLDP